MKLTIDFNSRTGRVKPMNAVNNGPIEKTARERGTQEDYISANIPYARTHDAALFFWYGGRNTVDVQNIFPDFDADPYDPASYFFQPTDEYMKLIEKGGAKIFFRLGSVTEKNSPLKVGTAVPKDMQKWAVICEHIIAHLNEGWADGYHFGIEYWEIWNEPDLEGYWSGTPEEFYELFSVAAKHLKSKFPNIKIGGPAVARKDEIWLRPFFEKLRRENVPLDFYSWHRYTNEPSKILSETYFHRGLLDEYGFTSTESICNEWNYICGWTDPDYVKSMETIISMKGAAFIAGTMACCQNAPVDMMMYYDARPCRFNGLFSFYTYKPLKGYYPIKAWGEMSKLGTACRVECDISEIYACAACGDDGEMAMITYYSDSIDAEEITFDIEMSGNTKALCRYLLDEEHDMTKECTAACGENVRITMKPNTVIILK